MQSESENKLDVKNAATKERSNSTIEFPYNDLENSIEIVRGIHEVQGTACDYEQLAAHLKQESKGGGFRLRISGTKCYGLITYERGGRLTLTDLGKQILESDMEKLARVSAFLNVPLYQRVFDEFKGRQLPPQAGIERAIQGFGVGANVKDKARQIMMRSAKQAGFFELSADRLTMPPNKQNANKERENSLGEENKNQEGKAGGNGGSNGSGGSGGGGMHPAFQLLLQTLPVPGSDWDTKQRLNWLLMANSAFNMIYKPVDEEIKIELKNPTKN